MSAWVLLAVVFPRRNLGTRTSASDGGKVGSLGVAFLALAMTFVPGDGGAQTVLEAGAGLEAEGALGAGRVQATARLSVRTARVPANVAFQAAQLADRFR